MSRKNRPVAIVGVGQTRHSSHREDVNQPELLHEAVRAALDDAGLTLDDIDAVVTGNMEMFEGIHQPDMWQVLGNGAWGKPCLRVSTGGTTGATVVCAADNLVASGPARCRSGDRVGEAARGTHDRRHHGHGRSPVGTPSTNRRAHRHGGPRSDQRVRGRPGPPCGHEIPRDHGPARGPQCQRPPLLSSFVRHDRRPDEKVAAAGRRAATDPYVLSIGRGGRDDLRLARAGPIDAAAARVGAGSRHGPSRRDNGHRRRPHAGRRRPHRSHDAAVRGRKTLRPQPASQNHASRSTSSRCTTRAPGGA